MWEVATGRRTGSFKLIDRRSIADPNLDTDVLSFNPANPILMSVSNKLLRLWNLQTGELIRKLEKEEIGERFQVRLTDWSPDGRLLMTGSKNDNAVLIWEILPK
jgi:WD40 repeat protein